MLICHAVYRVRRRAQAQPHVRRGAHQMHAHQNGGGKLGYDRGPGGARNAHFQDGNAVDIQHQVHNAADDQINERLCGVAGGPDEARAHIIYHHGDDADKVNAQIGYGVSHNVVRRAHELQHLGRPYKPRNCQHRAADYAQQHGAAADTAHIVRVPCAEICTVQHASAGGYAQEKAHQELNERAGGADGRQSLVAGVYAHNRSVNGVV